MNIPLLRVLNQQLLRPQFCDPAELVSWMGGIQAQDLHWMKWALGVRLRSSGIDKIDKALKQEVIDWESQFWKKELEPNVYNAPIDTTFAVYKPYFKGEIIDFNDTYIRTGFPYTIRHLPWYINSNSLSDEDKYYLSHIKTSTHWSEKEKNNKK